MQGDRAGLRLPIESKGRRGSEHGLLRHGGCKCSPARMRGSTTATPTPLPAASCCGSAPTNHHSHLRHGGIHVHQAFLGELPQRHGSEELGVGACRGAGEGQLGIEPKHIAVRARPAPDCVPPRQPALLRPARHRPPAGPQHLWALPPLASWAPAAQARSIQRPAGQMQACKQPSTAAYCARCVAQWPQPVGLQGKALPAATASTVWLARGRLACS